MTAFREIRTGSRKKIVAPNSKKIFSSGIYGTGTKLFTSARETRNLNQTNLLVVPVLSIFFVFVKKKSQ
jgi:hypothetical protein